MMLTGAAVPKSVSYTSTVSPERNHHLINCLQVIDSSVLNAVVGIWVATLFSVEGFLIKKSIPSQYKGWNTFGHEAVTCPSSNML